MFTFRRTLVYFMFFIISQCIIFVEIFFGLIPLDFSQCILIPIKMGLSAGYDDLANSSVPLFVYFSNTINR